MTSVGMGCQGAPGQPGVALDGRNGEPRGTGGDQGFVRRLLADLGEDAALEVEVIANALLDEKGLFDGLPQGSGDSCKRSHPLLGRPGLRETFATRKRAAAVARMSAAAAALPARRIAVPCIRRRRTHHPAQLAPVLPAPITAIVSTFMAPLSCEPWRSSALSDYSFGPLRRYSSFYPLRAGRQAGSAGLVPTT